MLLSLVYYFDGVLAAVPPCCIVRTFSAECACQCSEALLFSFEGHAIITGKRALLNTPLLFQGVSKSCHQQLGGSC